MLTAAQQSESDNFLPLFFCSSCDKFSSSEMDVSEYIRSAVARLSPLSSFVEYQTELAGCVHAETGDMEGFMEQLRALPTDDQKVDYVHAAIQRYGLFVDKYTQEAKNDKEADRHRRKGDNQFIRNEFIKSLDNYIRSIMKAESQELLARGYANRSAVLFKLGFYAECLADIDRAIAAGYPQEQRRSLEIRRQKATEEHNRNPPVPQCLPVPVIPESQRHRDFQCSHRDVGVETAASGRRRLIARRNLNVGDVLLVESPIAVDSSGKDVYHCHHCCKLCYNCIPCPRCTQVLYCSDQCRDEAHQQYHRHECRVLLTLKHVVGQRKPFLMGLKMTFRRQRGTPPKEVTFLRENLKLYEETGPDVLTIVLVAALMVDVLKTHSPGAVSRRDERRFKRDLVQNLKLSRLHSSGIDELVSQVDDQPELPDTEKLRHKSINVARGIFPFFSLIGHGCCVNAVAHHYGVVRVARAIRTIRRGEQLLVSYGPFYTRNTKPARQNHIKIQFNFTCTCRACREDWPQLDEQPYTVRCQDELDLITHVKTGSVEAAADALPTYIELVKRTEHKEPHIDVMMPHKMLCFCYDLLANRRRIP